MESWIETWAKYCGLLPRAEGSDSRSAKDDRRDGKETPANHVQPGAAPLHSVERPGPGSASNEPGPTAAVRPSGKRGNQMPFAEDAEEVVAEEIGVPRNAPGPGQQTIPGSESGGFRILDFPHRGRQGTVRLRGTVVEVKASTGSKFGDLSGESRRQIKDAVSFVQRIRSKATLVKDPGVRAMLEKVHVEVFSDLPNPKSGDFAEFILQELLEWKQIPRPVPASVPPGTRPGMRTVAPSSPKSIGKPGLGAVENIALGIVIALVEADVASEAYKKGAAFLNDLLRQIAENGDADEAQWRAIQDKLTEIANMKQSLLGYAWEFISYGQGSLPEKQALAMMALASELAEKFGYSHERTWGETFRGDPGSFKKEK